MIFEELEFELLNVLVSIGSIFLIYVAWKSTNVREDRLPPAAVLIIENNIRRRQDSLVNLPNHQERAPSRESSQSDTTEEVDFESDSLNQTPIRNFQISGAAPSLQEVINEVNDLATATGHPLVRSENNFSSTQSVEGNVNDSLDLEDIDELDQQQLINDMDNQDTAEVLRRRRLVFFSRDNTAEPNESSTGIRTETPIPQSLRRENLNLHTGDSAHAENCSNENNENENISKSEVNRIDVETIKERKLPVPPIPTLANELRIKLKYLNDDLRLVRGSPLEEVGAFKRRNFIDELASQKQVRLVFNGHVLQPDTKTLQACGLFDNCVVHCLVHKRPSNNPDSGSNENTPQHRQARVGSAGTRNMGSSSFTDPNGPLFIYFGIALVTLVIISCWYCRIQYSSIFSLYSTIGLILLTALFFIICPLIILIERDVSL